MPILKTSGAQPIDMRDGLLFAELNNHQARWVSSSQVTIKVGAGTYTLNGFGFKAGSPQSGVITEIQYSTSQGSSVLSGLNIKAAEFARLLTTPVQLNALLFGGADTLQGSAAADWLRPEGGDDIVYGMGGDDIIQGGSGSDKLDGGIGADYLAGESGDDWLLGGSGADRLEAGDGNDRLDGGTGADLMHGGKGDDVYIVNNLGDVVTEEIGGGGLDLVYSSITYALSVNIEDLTLTGSANINGTGNTLDNDLRGNAGSNVLDGEAGADQMFGGAGSDIYYVDNVGDRVFEGKDGGLDAVFSSVTFSLEGQYIENLTFTGSKAVMGTGNGLNNIMYGGSGWTVLNGGAGNDSLIFATQTGKQEHAHEAYGGAGNDNIRGAGSQLNAWGEAGNDNINGSLAGDYLYGGDGNDTINGQDGDDFINGGAGSDILWGSGGADRLQGGDGADRFVFQEVSLGAANHTDRIMDFNPSGGDVIDLRAIDADTTTAGDQAFHLVDAFTSHAGELLVVQSKAYATIFFDVNGDGKSDFSLRVDGELHDDNGWWL